MVIPGFFFSDLRISSLKLSVYCQEIPLNVSNVAHLSLAVGGGCGDVCVRVFLSLFLAHLSPRLRLSGIRCWRRCC